MVQIILMAERDQVRRQANSTLFGPRWLAWVLPTAAVGLVYFLIAGLGLSLYGKTNWVSVFWPAYGISAGVVIALGPSARLQVAAGVIIAILAAHLIVREVILRRHEVRRALTKRSPYRIFFSSLGAD
jgi:hypothetical protein